jgi:transcriptional regulator with XRE-family HTH domain
VATKQRLSKATRDIRAYSQELRRFGLNVRRQRHVSKLTIEQAAEKTQMDPTHLAKIEAGTVNVSFVTLVRISKGLGIPLFALFEF